MSYGISLTGNNKTEQGPEKHNLRHCTQQEFVPCSPQRSLPSWPFAPFSSAMQTSGWSIFSPDKSEEKREAKLSVFEWITKQDSQQGIKLRKDKEEWDS